MKKKPDTVKSLADIPEAEPAPNEIPAMEGKGVEKLTLPTIEKQKKIVASICTRRMELQREEREEREKLLALLDENGIDSYQCEDNDIVYVDDKRKAKIKSSDADE